MALDIATQAILDPLITERFNVIRRVETVGSNGRSTVAITTTNNVVGVVNMSDDIDLIREQFPEMEYATRVISIVSLFKLKTAVSGSQPDNVYWRGDTYVVKRVAPYPQYGQGFYEATCSSVDLTDATI